ncbi:mycofactocin-coupled SDR family oxidoreductase [Streptomyces sp. NBC_00258]|uniref:mycofactocin-coupled SDR family oxidoreductase n=1 Tax=Streptomyces sp. NBC_00258 TaxID=2903642 RepID=UPI002E29272D|nr:mycofactocin-coupled SDR family oxidoreductase [Streptomyces sp. NBC_00258]
MGRLDGKVAFITGAARGVGRSLAVRFAEEGADIIAVDLCAPVAGVDYHESTPDDLSETVSAVESLGRRIIASAADVRDFDGLKAALDVGVAKLGRLDIVCPNAGINTFADVADMPAQTWQNMIDVTLTGVFHTCKAALPHLAPEGAIVITNSVAGLKGAAGIAHYSAAKHGAVGFMRSLAHELADRMIRVNSVHPTGIKTDMVVNEVSYRLFVPGDPNPTPEKLAEATKGENLLPIPWVEPRDIANAALFLASNEARYITGVALPVDGGAFIL